MPFRSFLRSWRRVSGVAVLALLMVIAPQATNLCSAVCARASGAMAMSTTPTMPSPPSGQAGHCAAHAASRHAAHAVHACGMPSHALPVQVDTTTATVASARTTPAQLPQPLSTAIFSATATAATSLFASGAHPPHVPPGFAAAFARSARSHPLTLSLALRI